MSKGLARFGGVGPWAVFWGWVAVMGWGWPLWAAGNPVYWVEGVTVVVDSQALAAAGKSPDSRQVGLQQAKRIALERLFRRIIADQDRKAYAAFLESLTPKALETVERSVVRSEKKREDGLNLTVDILFSQSGIRALLGQESQLAYNDTPYPKTLLVARDQGKSGEKSPKANPECAFAEEWLPLMQKAASERGIRNVTALGDVDAMVNLNWQRIESANSEMLRWASSRYGAGMVWGITLEGCRSAKATPSEASSASAERSKRKPPPPPRAALAAVLLESGPSGPVNTVRVRVDGTGEGKASGPSTGKNDLMTQLADRLAEAVVQRWLARGGSTPDGSGTGLAVKIQVSHEWLSPGYPKFLKAIRELSGVSVVRVEVMQARQTTLSMEWRKDEQSLEAALETLGGSWEKTPEGEFRVRLP